MNVEYWKSMINKPDMLDMYEIVYPMYLQKLIIF